MRRWLALFRGFRNVLVKELKELVRDPKILLGMIIVPLIMFPALGAVMSLSIQSAAEQAQKATVLVINNDGQEYSQVFISYLGPLVKTVINNTTAEDIVQQLATYNATQIVEIPEGFSTNISRHINEDKNITTYIRFYSVFSGASISEAIGSSMIDMIVESFNRQQAPNLISATKLSIIKGKIESVDPQMLSNVIFSQAIAMPITIMILLTYSMQIAATSVAMEKEEKTLEMLLSLPVDRFAILMGKLSGSIVVAAIGAVAYMIGFNYYMGSFMATLPAGQGIDLVALGLAPTILGYFLLGVSLFVTLLSALALAVVLSAFAEDVRSAQSLVGYIYPFLFVPSLLLMYVDVNTLPIALKVAIFAIPYSHPIIASKAVIMGDYFTASIGIIYVSAFTLIIMYAASRLFATEKILTAKLKFKGFRKREKKPKEDLQ
ncbi:MAG: ABC transporter permease [Candidatus Bathyarchaeia archaeon]